MGIKNVSKLTIKTKKNKKALSLKEIDVEITKFHNKVAHSCLSLGVVIITSKDHKGRSLLIGEDRPLMESLSFSAKYVAERALASAEKESEKAASKAIRETRK